MVQKFFCTKSCYFIQQVWKQEFFILFYSNATPETLSRIKILENYLSCNEISCCHCFFQNEWTYSKRTLKTNVATRLSIEKFCLLFQMYVNCSILFRLRSRPPSQHQVRNQSPTIKQKPLNVITMGQKKSDNINRIASIYYSLIAITSIQHSLINGTFWMWLQ